MQKAYKMLDMQHLVKLFPQFILASITINQSFYIERLKEFSTACGKIAK